MAPSKSLHQRFLDGMTIKSRENGTVHTIKGENGRTVGEVCVGKSKTRVNFRNAPEAKALKASGISLSGNSNSWKGQGFVLTEENLQSGRKLMQAVISAAQPTPEEAQAASQQAQAEKGQARERAAEREAEPVEA